jgi:putative transposase
MRLSECLALEADTSLGSGRVTRALDRLIDMRGKPESLRSDNGPEFTSRRMLIPTRNSVRHEVLR